MKKVYEKRNAFTIIAPFQGLFKRPIPIDAFSNFNLVTSRI